MSILKNTWLILVLTASMASTTHLFGQEKYTSQYIFELMERRDLKLDEVKELADKYFEVVGRERGTGHKHFMRWHYEQQFHLDDRGYILDPQIEAKALLDGLKAMKNTAERGSSANNNAWVELGPQTVNVTTSWNPGSGRVRGLDVNLANQQVMYAATDGGGVWKTINGGTNWFPTMDALTNNFQSVNQVVIDQTNTNTVYAILRNSNIVRSTDAGATWATFYSSGPTNTRRIALVPGSPGLILATTNTGISRSTNGGASWTNVQTVTSGLEDIVVQPGSTTIMYAAGSGSQCFWRSTDAGLTWTNIGSGSGITNTGRSLIGVSPANPQVVYVVQASGSVFGRLYKSTNGGQTFITTVVGNAANGTAYFGYSPNGTNTDGQATHDMAIAVHPTNTEVLHIAGIICWKSTNGGTSFTATTDWTFNNSYGYNHADVLWMGYLGGTLYSTSDGGPCKSNNHADDWVPMWNTLACKQIYRACSANSQTSTIGFGAQDNGHAYKVGTGNWNQWLGADGMDVAISPTNNLLAVAAIQYGGIYRTTNGGSSYASLTRPNEGNWITPLVWHPTDSTILFGGWAGVFRSNNKGSSWTAISSTAITSKVNCLAVAASNPNYIYASVGSTFYVTTNGGTNWTSYSIGATVSAIAVSPINPTKVYLTTTSTSSHVRMSTNAGATFTAINTGLPAVAARAITIDDNTDETVYVGLNSGVYSRDNINSTWVVVGTGLPLAQVNDLDIQQSSNKLRVATYGRGMWEIDITPPAPICAVPTNLGSSGVTVNQATLSWTATPGALSYMLEYKLASSSTWTTIVGLTATTITLSSLTPARLYDWRVQATCATNSSLYATSTFTTLSFATLSLSQTFIAGYMDGSVMRPVLQNSGVPGATSGQCDSITIALHSMTSPHGLQFEQKVVLSATSGTATADFPSGALGNSYYIVIKGRNIIETWSANPVPFSTSTSYHFGSSAQAYGNNLGNIGGISVIKSGDFAIPQDGNVDLLDYPEWESNYQAFMTGYFASDLNGDGRVDLLDYPIWESNYNNFTTVIRP
jgi:hypothetical protein